MPCDRKALRISLLRRKAHKQVGTRSSWLSLAYSSQWWVNPWETTSQRLTTWLKHTYLQHGHDQVTGKKVSDIRSFQALREKHGSFLKSSFNLNWEIKFLMWTLNESFPSIINPEGYSPKEEVTLEKAFISFSAFKTSFLISVCQGWLEKFKGLRLSVNCELQNHPHKNGMRQVCTL